MKQLRVPTSWGELRVAGGSRAGEASMVLLPQLRLALDAGRPARALVAMQHLVITHGHMDHTLGLPAWASQRLLSGIPGGIVYAPKGLAPKVEELLKVCIELEGGTHYNVSVLPVTNGEAVSIRPDFTLKFFTTSHWVETLGCCLRWTRHRLRPEWTEKGAEELRLARGSGIAITEEVTVDLVAYLGDTGPEVFDQHPWLVNVEVLITECTFLHDKDRERAKEFGHTHLADLVALAPRLANRHLILTHLSRRHRLAPATTMMRKALVSVLRPQLHFLNNEWE